MAILLQNRAISMILMVPDVEHLVSSDIVEKLDRSDIDQITSNNETNSSMPVYHGSIVRIEQHNDNENISDLIVRVPNFQSPSITISSESSIVDDQSSDTNSKRIKRRAPICPINLSNPPNKLDLSDSKQNVTRVANTSRLTTGLRSLSRVFTHGCKSKRSSSINEITFPPTLPDVEVMTEQLQLPIASGKSTRYESTMPKLITPKMLSIQRKDLKIKKKDSSPSISIDTSTDIENKRNEHDNQTASIQFNYEVDQLIPISSIDAESLSTHRYSIVSDIPTENLKIVRPFHVQTSILQPDISVVRIGTTDLRTEIDRLLPGEKRFNEENDLSTNNQSFIHMDIEQKENDWYKVIQSTDESYEVTYQLDPEYQNSIENKKSNDLTSALTTWLPSILPLITPNEYEQIEQDNIIAQQHEQFPDRDHSLEYLETKIPKKQRIKSRSVDDLSRTSNDQTSTYQAESTSISSSTELSPRHCTLQRSNSYNGFGIYVSTDMETRREHFVRQIEEMSPGERAGLKENDRILCINGISVVNEDYTVVLQLIKDGLQTNRLNFDVITNDVYNEFKSQIDQLYQATENEK